MADYLTDATFRPLVVEATIPVIVDFCASWCGPCRMVSPILEEIVAEREGKLQMYKLDVDEYPDAAQFYHIQSIPAMILFENGKAVKKVIGAMPKEELLERLGLD